MFLVQLIFLLIYEDMSPVADINHMYVIITPYIVDDALRTCHPCFTKMIVSRKLIKL